MTKRPSPLRRATQQSSSCIVTAGAISTVLPYTSRSEFERTMNAKATRAAAKLPRAIARMSRV